MQEVFFNDHLLCALKWKNDWIWGDYHSLTSKEDGDIDQDLSSEDKE